MALTVETGTGSATSESYASVAEADAYHVSRGNVSWLESITIDKERALRRATDYMIQIYRQRWKGVRLNAVQALDWPRFNVYLEPVLNGIVSDYPYLVASNIVPTDIKNACIRLAFIALSGDLLADTTQQVMKEVIGPVQYEYDKFSEQTTQYRSIDAMLCVYFNSASGIEHKIVR